MAGLHEGDLAWDLVDQHRDCLTPEERDRAFVHLGIGEFPPVIRSVLNALVRERKTLSANSVTDVQAWIDNYDRTREFATLLAVVTEAVESDKSA